MSLNTSSPEQKPPIPQRGQPMLNVTIADMDDIPRSRSNPTFETSPRLLNEIRDDLLLSTVPGPSSMFQRAREVDIGGNPSFINGNVYHNHYNHVTRSLAQISSVEFAARRNERRADIIKQLGEEVKELTQLLQEKTEELSQMEDNANRQNAKQTEDIKQLEAELMKLNQLLQTKTGERSRMEDSAKQQNAKQAEVIRRLEAELRKLNRLLQEKTEKLSRVEDNANRQNAKHAENIKQFEAELRKLNQLLQEKAAELASMKEVANRQKGRNKMQIRILEEEVSGMIVDMIQQKEKVSGMIADMIQQKERHEKEIWGSEAVVKPSTHSNTDLAQIHGNMSGGAQPSKSKLKQFTAVYKNLTLGNRKQQSRDNDSNRLSEDVEIFAQAKPEQREKISEQHRATDLSQNLASQHSVPIEQPTDPMSITTKDTEQQREQDQDDFFHIEPEKLSKLEIEIASLKELLVEHHTAMASLQELVVEQKNKSYRNDPGSPTTNDKVRKIKPVVRESEVTTSPIQERPGEGLVFREADGLSLTDVANLVRELNVQIDVTATLIIDLLRSLESSSSGGDSEIAVHSDLQEYLGSWLCKQLQRRSEEHEVVAQIALQAGLVYACSHIINDWNPPFWAEGLALSRVYDNLEGPIAADIWGALTRNHMGVHMGVHNDQLEANKKYLEEVLLKLIIAVSGSQQSGKTLLQQCHEKVDVIAKKAIDIHQAISQETRSTDLSTFTVESGADFDQSRMEDTEGCPGPSSSKVVCTLEMGLGSRKRVPSRQQSGDGKVGGVTLKAKVVLFATLAVYGLD